jgi:hypothetical protein
MTDKRRPLHIAWLVGLSASIYAANLAAVTAMQAGTDASVAAQVATKQVPAQAALDALRAHDAAVAATIERASTSLKSGAAQYAQAGKNLAALEQRLAGLGKSAGSLKALPAVPTGGGSGSVVAAPVVHTTTGASGAKP